MWDFLKRCFGGCIMSFVIWWRSSIFANFVINKKKSGDFDIHNSDDDLSNLESGTLSEEHVYHPLVDRPDTLVNSHTRSVKLRKRKFEETDFAEYPTTASANPSLVPSSPISSRSIESRASSTLSDKLVTLDNFSLFSPTRKTLDLVAPVHFVGLSSHIARVKSGSPLIREVVNFRHSASKLSPVIPESQETGVIGLCSYSQSRNSIQESVHLEDKEHECLDAGLATSSGNYGIAETMSSSQVSMKASVEASPSSVLGGSSMLAEVSEAVSPISHSDLEDAASFQSSRKDSISFSDLQLRGVSAFDGELVSPSANDEEEFSPGADGEEDFSPDAPLSDTSNPSEILGREDLTKVFSDSSLSSQADSLKRLKRSSPDMTLSYEKDKAQILKLLDSDSEDEANRGGIDRLSGKTLSLL